MNEIQWAKSVQELVNRSLAEEYPYLAIEQGFKLRYANEILEYDNQKPKMAEPVEYETDLLVIEKSTPNIWKPRVVIECKINRVTTHDAITYSEKSYAHKKSSPLSALWNSNW